MSDKRFYAVLVAAVVCVALMCGYSIDTIAHALRPVLVFFGM